MSNDNEKEQSLAEDEAFIDSLYDRLSDEATPADLDQRILAAAHREVSAKPQLVKKRPVWLKPLASAATVLLVVTVSLHQIFDPGNSLDSSAGLGANFDDELMPVEEVSDSLLAEKELPKKAYRELSAVPTSVPAPALAPAPKPAPALAPVQLQKEKSRSRALKPSKDEARQMPVLAMKKMPEYQQVSPKLGATENKDLSPASEMDVVEQESVLAGKEESVNEIVASEPIAEASLVVSDTGNDVVSGVTSAGMSVSSSTADKQKKLSKESNNLKTAVHLTENDYQQLIDQDAQWMYVEESEDSYLIYVILEDEMSAYTLDKTLFILETVIDGQALASGRVYSIPHIKIVGQKN